MHDFELRGARCRCLDCAGAGGTGERDRHREPGGRAGAGRICRLRADLPPGAGPRRAAGALGQDRQAGAAPPCTPWPSSPRSPESARTGCRWPRTPGKARRRAGTAWAPRELRRHRPDACGAHRDTRGNPPGAVERLGLHPRRGPGRGRSSTTTRSWANEENAPASAAAKLRRRPRPRPSPTRSATRRRCRSAPATAPSTYSAATSKTWPARCGRGPPTGRAAPVAEPGLARGPRLAAVHRTVRGLHHRRRQPRAHRRAAGLPGHRGLGGRRPTPGSMRRGTPVNAAARAGHRTLRPRGTGRGILRGPGKLSGRALGPRCTGNRAPTSGTGGPCEQYLCQGRGQQG